MGGRAGDQGTEEREVWAMSYSYIPQVPDYNTPPSGYEVPDDYPDYQQELNQDYEREHDDEDQL